MDLNTAIEEIPRVGSVFVKKLKKIGIKTVEDLLFHFPRRYEDFSNIKPIAEVKLNEQNCLAGKILGIKTARTWKRKMTITQAVVEDSSGAIEVVWFNQPYLENILKPGDWVSLAGKATISKNSKRIYLSNPVFEKIPVSDADVESDVARPDGRVTSDLKHTGRIIPVYPETEGLSSRWLRYIIYPLLKELGNKIPEILPEKILKENNLMPANRAIWQAHFPESMKQAEEAKKRFSFEELFLIELSVLKERAKLDQKKAPAIKTNVKITKNFVESLPFRLTDSQRKCAWRILKDLEKPRPMSRLLQGDVGSGKTVVALIAALNVTKAGYQTAFMAPTEILAKQHFNEAVRLLLPFKIRIALLTGKEDKIISQKLANETIEISRQKIIEKSKNGEIDLLIGTHALVQDKVKFGKLGLCVVDEQHRFGVEQRAKLINSDVRRPNSDVARLLIIPHFLSMTATPIPRSLALTIYGDLDLSILNEMPKGRKKIITKVVAPEEREKTYDFIRERVKQDEQVFVICPRIERPAAEVAVPLRAHPKTPSPWDDVKVVEEEYEKLSQKIFPDLKIAKMHGRLKPKEKEKIMRDFKNKKIDILVSTSVVEVGIDIANATIMFIEGAERFGLSQLHQFRGRVGRSDLQSYCFLFTEAKGQKIRSRLKAMLKAKDGFELAERDLAIRGPGTFLGLKQSGIPDLAMENLKNLALVETTRECAKGLLENDPELEKHPLLKKRLTSFSKILHLE